MLVQSSRFLFTPIHKRIPSILSFSVASSAMDTASPSLLFLCVKSSTETEIAKSLKISGALNLPNGGKVSTLLQSEISSFQLGIGLNVGNENPTTCLNTELKELAMSSDEFRREDIMAAFFNKFEMLYDIFINQGFQTLEQLYYRTWFHSGQRIIVQEKNDSRVSENVVTVQGLTSSGYLLAIDDNHKLCELHPDGNSFDFFKGLVRRKLE